MTPDTPTATAPIRGIDDDAQHLEELRHVADDILGRAWSPRQARAALDGDEPAWHPELWSTVCSLGWADLRREPADTDTVAELELCVFAESLGAALAPAPLAVAAAASLLGQGGADGFCVLLEGAAAVEHGAGGQTVSGAWPSVPFGAVADRFVAEVPTGAGASKLVGVPADAVTRTALRPLDRSPDASVTLEPSPLTELTVLDPGPDAAGTLRRARRVVLLGRAAELVGVADRATASAVEYAKDRVAFGHPIGTFQAIKHRLVDQRADVEVARALVRRAARASQDGRADADPLASLAAFWAIDRLRAVTEGTIQVFGGIGYTWDHPAHLYLRRAACLTAALGARRLHRDAVTSWLLARHGRRRL